jgi:hypothetical protein
MKKRILVNKPICKVCGQRPVHDRYWTKCNQCWQVAWRARSRRGNQTRRKMLLGNQECHSEQDEQSHLTDHKN